MTLCLKQDPHHVHVLSFTGVGAKSLFDHLESPTTAWPSLPSGAFKKSMKASLDWKGAAISALLGIESLPIFRRHSPVSRYRFLLESEHKGYVEIEQCLLQVECGIDLYISPHIVKGEEQHSTYTN